MKEKKKTPDVDRCPYCGALAGSSGIICLTCGRSLDGQLTITDY